MQINYFTMFGESLGDERLFCQIDFPDSNKRKNSWKQFVITWQCYIFTYSTHCNKANDSPGNNSEKWNVWKLMWKRLPSRIFIVMMRASIENMQNICSFERERWQNSSTTSEEWMEAKEKMSLNIIDVC